MIKEKYEWVKNKLSKHPELRDSNERLYYHYLLDIGYDITKPFKEALKDMEGRIIPFIDSIARASRKIQEEHPHLRGKTYGKRKARAKDIKQEIKDLT